MAATNYTIAGLHLASHHDHDGDQEHECFYLWEINSVFLPIRRKKYGIVSTNIAWMDILERGCEPRTRRLSKQGIEKLDA